MSGDLDVQAATAAPQAENRSVEAPSAVLVYLEKRLMPQKLWHETTASRSKAMHTRVSLVQVSALAFIPLANTLASTGAEISVAFVTSAFAAVGAIATGLMNVGRYQETWLRSRRTVSALEALLMRHELRVAPFDAPDRDTRFIEEAEAILSGEQEQWSDLVRSGAADKKKPQDG